MQGIYCLIDKDNGKYYVGRAKDINKRIKDHFSGNANQTKADRIFKEKGINNFEIKVLCSFPEEMELDNCYFSLWEDYFCLLYNAIIPNGYNSRYNSKQVIREDLIILMKTSLEPEEIVERCYLRERMRREKNISDIFKELLNPSYDLICSNNIADLNEKKLEIKFSLIKRDFGSLSLKQKLMLQKIAEVEYTSLNDRNNFINQVREMIERYSSLEKLSEFSKEKDNIYYTAYFLLTLNPYN